VGGGSVMNLLKKLFAMVKGLQGKFGADGKILDTILPNSNIVNGNAEGSLRSINGKTDYTMGNNAFALGLETEASGYSSLACGYSCVASGDSSVALGQSCRALGGTSFAMGITCSATKQGAFATGYECQSNGFQSFALGQSAIAKGDNSLAAGWGTIAKYGQFVMGKYNIESSAAIDTYDVTKEAFIIGNGDYSTDTRSNAFVVYFNGNVDIFGDIDVKGSTTLNTTSKKIIGAINELESGKQSIVLVDYTSISTPLEGRQAWNTTTHKPVYYNGTAWIYADGTAV
jgi:hypothetical protein